ncbi:HNH endonuclease [Halorhabdus tiamatea]|nr:HNH endonuclease [Halorhabdus tiamatea]
MHVGRQRLSELSEAELREVAEASVIGDRRTTTESSQTQYRRPEIVKQYALRVADGVCQGGGDEAPFLDEDGEPFLEVHYLHRRSDGGADHPDNVVALCPNCHRRVHYEQNGDAFNQQLIEGGVQISADQRATFCRLTSRILVD